MSSFFAALGIVFLAELGDKTQLVALGFGARYRLSTVLAGVACGYMASMLLSVVIGGLLGAALPTNAISIGGGLLFVVFAILSLRSARSASADDDEDLIDDLELDELGLDELGLDELGLDELRSDGSTAGTTDAAARNTRVIASIAAAMFVAELGDKTMLATATLAAQGNPVLVWFGATVGIMLAGTVGVVIGRWLGDRLPERVILIGSSLLFLVFGIVLIVSGILGAT
jgi:putative Ca2+/H+ antiporter (TMEM165/GDT1 family)